MSVSFFHSYMLHLFFKIRFSATLERRTHSYCILVFRWQKISRAMGGRRTPRQVASRVQKYLEKLKKFGVDA